MTDVKVTLPADPRFEPINRSPASQKDIEAIRKWTREAQTHIQMLGRAVQDIEARLQALEAE